MSFPGAHHRRGPYGPSWSDELSADFNGSTSLALAEDTTTLDALSEGAVIRFWIKTTITGAGNTAIVMGKGSFVAVDGWYVRVLGSATGTIDGRIGMVRIDADVGNGEYRSTTAINDGEWHHVVVRPLNTAGAVEFYIDGGSMESELVYFDGFTTYSNSEPFALGGASDGSSPFDGRLDEVAVYLGNPDSSIHAELYNSGVPFDVRTGAHAAQLAAYYWLGDADDAGTLYQRSDGSAANLTNTDVSYSSDVPP